MKGMHTLQPLPRSDDYMSRAFAPAEERFRNQVMADTWGHLAPRRYKVYRGFIVFAHGDFGDLVVIQCDFKDLDSSPWFFEDLNEFVSNWIMAQGEDTEGTIWRFDGTYKKYAQHHVFSGEVKVILKPAE